MPRLDDPTVEKLVDVLPRAQQAGVQYTALGEPLGCAFDGGADDVRHALEAPPRSVHEQLQSLFTDCSVENLEAVRTELDKLVHEVEQAERPGITTTWDARASVARTWWGPEDDDELGAVRDADTDDVESPRTGRVVLVGVSGAQVGEGNEQTNVFVHEVADPRIDFRRVLEQDAVCATLAALTQDPQNHGLRAAAVTALTSARPESSSVLRILDRVRHRLTPPAVGRTLRVTRAAGVTIGDDVEQENFYEQVASLGRGLITEARRGAATIRQAAADRASGT